jgi:DMSO/TMAO reductase YedYZ molybdopterin-dependent catalytic subunit
MAASVRALAPAITLVAAVGAVVLLATSSEPVERLHPTLEDAAAAQVLEHDGQALSSILDSREKSISGPRYIDPAGYSLSIVGLVRSDTTLSYEQVIADHEIHQRVATLDCEEGWGVTLLWEGVLVRDLLDRAGVLPEAKIVIFRSVDGYSTSLFLDYLYDNDIILAHKVNGVPLPPELGYPFQVVAEGKWGYKWSKWVHEIEVSDDVLYEGHWESQGFSNKADLDEPFLD